MKTTEFCYWLQGFFEVRDAGDPDARKDMTAAQVEMVKRHLALVFQHDIDPAQVAESLQSIHDGTPTPAPQPVPIPSHFRPPGFNPSGMKMRC